MKKQTIASLAVIGAVGVAGLFGSQNTFAKVAVNTAFEDERFYQCVVTAYNNKEGEDKDYQTDVLTDAELLKVTSLDCDNKRAEDINKIASVTGLEKLTNLTSLKLYGNQIESIDLSKNTELLELDIRFNKLNSLDITNNVKLKTLKIESVTYTETDNNNIQTIDISQNPNIELIKAQGSMLINNLQLVPIGNGYTIDLNSLKFVTSGNASVTTNFHPEYSYDQNNRILTIPDITKVSSIHMDTDLNEGFNLFVDKSGLADNNQANEENNDEEVEVPNTSTTEQDNTNTEASTKKSTSPKTPETGDSTNNNDAIKSLPIIMLAVSATAFLMYRISKIITRKRVRF